LQVWSAPKCQVDAQPIAALPAVTAAQITETISGSDSAVLTMPADVARAAGIAEGRIIRAIVPLRGVVEWVVATVRDSDPTAAVSVTCAPLKHLLALRGLVRETTTSSVTTQFTPAALTVTELLTRYVLTNLDADGLSWLSLGTIEYTDRVTVGTLSSIRRGELLTLIERITGYEVALRRLPDDTGYAIDVLDQRGAALPTLLMESPVATSITRTRDLTTTATGVMPIGTDGRPMGDVDWIGGAAIGAGPYWIPLTDPNGGPAPVREDQQFAGLYLRLADGSSLAIAATRAADSAVRVASLGTYTTGQRVFLAETIAGRPISLISSPSALAAARGMVVAKVTAKGARYERTINRNAGFEDGGTYTSEVNGSNLRVAIPRAEFGVSRAFLSNGARASGTSVATLMPVDGLPAGTWIRRGDVIEHAAATRELTASVHTSSTGTLSLTLASPGVPAATADGQTVRLSRRFLANAVSAIAMPRLGGLVYLTTASVGTADLRLMLGGRGMTEPTGGAQYGGPNGYAFNLYPAAGDSSRVAVTAFQTTNDPLVESVAYTRSVTAIVATGAQSLTLTLGSLVSSGTPSVGQWMVCEASTGANWAAIGLSEGAAPYLYPNGGFRLIGQVASVTGTEMVLSLAGYPAAADFRAVGTITPHASHTHPDVLATAVGSPVVYGLTNAWASGSTFVLEAERLAPLDVQLNGAYLAGATAITTKPIAAIATRAFASGDSLTVDTGLPSVTFTATMSGRSGMVATVSTTGSNVHLYSVAELQQVSWSIGCAFTYDVYDSNISSYLATGVTGDERLECTLASRTGAAYTFTAPATVDTSTPGVYWELSGVSIAYLDVLSELRRGGVITMPVTGAATFSASTGVAAVPATVPAGYTVPRGAVVWTNAHGSSDASAMRCATTVTGPAASIDIFGGDTVRTDPALGGAYLVKGGAGQSTVSFPGNTLVAWADVQANSSGQASITLKTATSSDIADNASLSLVRPALFGDTDRTTGSAVRLLYAVGGAGTPTISTPGTQLETVTVAVAAGEITPMVAVARFRVTPGVLGVGGAPIVALVNLTTNTVLASGTVPTGGVTAYAPYGVIECVARAVLTETAALAVRIYGGSSSVFSTWHVCTDASLYLGTEILSYVNGSRSRVAFQRGQDVLAQRKRAARFVVRGIDTAALTASGTPVQIGQQVRLRSAALEVDTTERIVALTWRWPGAELIEMECAALTPRLTDVEVSA
jgi:hypothetical protein